MPDPTPEQIEEARRLTSGTQMEDIERNVALALYDRDRLIAEYRRDGENLLTRCSEQKARIEELEARIRHLEGNKNVDRKGGL